MPTKSFAQIAYEIGKEAEAMQAQADADSDDAARAETITGAEAPQWVVDELIADENDAAAERDRS